MRETESETARETERVLSVGRVVPFVCLSWFFQNREAETAVQFVCRQLKLCKKHLSVSLSLSVSHRLHSPFFLNSQKNRMYICQVSSISLEWIDRNRVVNLSEEKIKDPTERHRLYKQQSAQRFSDFYIVITVKRT